MRILQLCHKPPLPAIDGGCIAMNNITGGLLTAGHEVRVLTITTEKHPFRPDLFPEGYQEQTKIESVYVDTKVNLVDAFSNLVTSDSYNVSRFFSADFDMKLIKVLHETDFDVIHLESLFMTPYVNTIHRHSKAKVIVRSHNLEYMIWERMARATKNLAKQMYLTHLAKQLKKYELNIFPQIDGIAAITPEDADKYKNLGCKLPIVTIPFGIDLQHYNMDIEKAEHPTLFHLGSMDWMPNKEGVEWFLREVWPSITKQQPNVKLYLAGRNMSQQLLDLKMTNVEVVGEVDDAKEFISSKSVMLVPLLSAGGMRVKIIEGMALGKTIISTKVGAEGIECENLQDILIANNADEFAFMINKVIADDKIYREIGDKARTLVEQKYDNRQITEALVTFYEEVQRR
jgi:glycosyltransferase involved in cell wall biosynthesis